MIDEEVWRTYRLGDVRNKHHYTAARNRTFLFSLLLPCFSITGIVLASAKREEEVYREDETDKEKGISYSGDEIMSFIERDNIVLIQAAVTPHGQTSPLFSRLLYLYGHGTESHFRDRPNANICKASARSTKVPHNILGRANHIWTATHPHEFYGEFYKSMDPRTYFDQSLG